MAPMRRNIIPNVNMRPENLTQAGRRRTRLQPHGSFLASCLVAVVGSATAVLHRCCWVRVTLDAKLGPKQQPHSTFPAPQQPSSGGLC